MVREGLMTLFRFHLRSPALAMLLLLLAGAAGNAFAASDEAPFTLFYQGRETLVLHRLQLDPSTHEAPLGDGQAAVYQDELPPVGPELDALKARVTGGMGLVVILGADVDAASLEAITDGAVEQTGVVNTPEGAAHAAAAEKIAAIIGYVGPASDPLATNISW